MRSSVSLLRCLARTSAPRAAYASPRAHTSIPVPLRCFHTPRTAAPVLLRPSKILTGMRPFPSGLRHESTRSNVPPQTGASSTTPPDSRLERDQVPAYEMTFTCNKCNTRSSHRVSKQGYHHGTVLITCPGCKNRHLMSDHLKVHLDPPTPIIRI
ncbi:zf-DNL-domain-containing protein [Pleomassaria siparia CBS 279.74]|uniref:Zf-DNL-domain-containing protein n=1 Tax=Pleomassaria siparia CBS 279.74 TaxID=1314801 RepID=A0A6G1JS46_9PLEO|nr:zf-DNL-domain-containing protein [Pleomassaria siparia CBS 279.74]